MQREQLNSPTVGWLGTGRMGAAMAGRLIDAGVAVTVWNRTAAKTEPLRGRGATVASALGELGGCEVVFTMVSTPSDLEQVLVGDGGLLTARPHPAIIVDCSTVDPQTSARVRAEVNATGAQFLAAPISGNPHVVAGGEAVLVSSGPRVTYDRTRALLETIARVAIYAGDGEQARVVKICHNLYLGMLAQSLSEVTVLAEKSGVDRAAFLEFLNSTVLATEWVRRRTPDMLALDWTPTFTTELLRKDFDLGLAAARQQEVTMPLAAGVMQILQSAIGHGYRDADFLSLFELEATLSGLHLAPTDPDTQPE